MTTWNLEPQVSDEPVTCSNCKFRPKEFPSAWEKPSYLTCEKGHPIRCHLYYRTVECEDFMRENRKLL